MSKCCVICVGRNADRAADRIEAYAKKADFEIVETIFKDTKSVERLKFYIERDSIISILVSSIYDISSDKDVVKGIMELRITVFTTIFFRNRCNCALSIP